jgi:hypothetical protein
MQMDMRGRGTWGSLCHNQSAVRIGRVRRGVCDALDGSRETLIPLGVVVLEANLQFDGLDEVTFFFAIGFGEEFLDGAPHA